MSASKKIPKQRALHPRVRVFCKKCGHVSRRYFDLVHEPCCKCGSTRVICRPKGGPKRSA
jgi:hypothetical protein